MNSAKTTDADVEMMKLLELIETAHEHGDECSIIEQAAKVRAALSTPQPTEPLTELQRLGQEFDAEDSDTPLVEAVARALHEECRASAERIMPRTWENLWSDEIDAYRRQAQAAIPIIRRSSDTPLVDEVAQAIADCDFGSNMAQARLYAQAAIPIVRRAVLAEIAGWQPIETAPKDGTPIIVTNDVRGGSWVAQYKEQYASGMCPENPWSSLMLNTRWHANQYASMKPTRWMPLPPAIESGEITS